MRPYVWRELKSLEPGAILEEEAMNTILNVVVGRIVRSEDRADPLNYRYLARDMFEHFLMYHCAPKEGHLGVAAWVKNKMHDPHSTGLDRSFGHIEDDNTAVFQRYMERAVCLEDMGGLTRNVAGYALLTAIVASASVRYAAALRGRDDKDKKKFSLYVGLLFSAVKAAVSAAPMGGGAAGEVVGMVQDATNYVIDNSKTWEPRDIGDCVAQTVIGVYYNPAVDGIRVPGLTEKRVSFDPSDTRHRKERERRIEIGRHYAEMAHRYLAEMMPSLMLWSPPPPHSYIPE